MRKPTLLKILRLQTGMTQHDVANKMGCSQSRYSELERLDRKPTDSDKRALSRIFRVSREVLDDE